LPFVQLVDDKHVCVTELPGVVMWQQTAGSLTCWSEIRHAVHYTTVPRKSQSELVQIMNPFITPICRATERQREHH